MENRIPRDPGRKNRMQREFEPQPWAAAEVRRFVAASLPDAHNLDDLELAASELASNVIRHAQTPFTVAVRRAADRIRLEVSDGNSIIPAVEDLAEDNRGLRLLQAITIRWGIDPHGDGKTIWAEFPAD